MREIVLLRHGKPEIPEKTCLGITDVPLSEEGRTGVYRLREEGLLTGISRIITSPLSRCRETAKILSDGKIPVTVEEDLREISMGAWDGLTFSEIKERFPEEYAARGEDIADYEVPGGESFRACQKRVYQAWQRIRTACDGNLLVVCHAGVIRCLISSIEHRDLSRLREIPVSYGEAIRIPDPVYDGLITAAGRSSRMGDFKPLMELGGRPAILRILDRFSEAGVRHTVVVTGRQAEDLKAAVRREWDESRVSFVHNEGYETNQMFDSVKMGLSALRARGEKTGTFPDGVFFTPVDVPAFSGITMELEKTLLKEKGVLAVKPVCDCRLQPGKNGRAEGHPLLIDFSAVPPILAHDGTMGLKGALDGLGDAAAIADTPDKGAAMDTDTPEDFLRVMKYLEKRYIFQKDSCTELLSWCKIRPETAEHCLAVGRMAEQIVDALQKAGYVLNRGAVLMAACLHDIGKCRGSRNHAEYGAWLLSQMGYMEASEMVRFHTDLPRSMQESVCGSTVVYLADKLVQGTETVPVKWRFLPKFEKFRENPEALAAVQTRYLAAMRAADTIRKACGACLTEELKGLLKTEQSEDEKL